MKHYLALLGALVVAGLSVASCTSILGGFQANGTEPDASMSGDDATSSGDSGPANGTACTSGSQCGSGFCADGVCCNNACSGTCESCSVMGHVGTCTGYAVNTDPEKECLSVSEREALEAGSVDSAVEAGEGGSGDGGAGEGGDGGKAEDGGSASDAGDAAADGSSDGASDAQVIVLPEGGVTSNDMPCTGSCNGKGGSGQGACTYPGSSTSCGTAWCNTEAESAQFVCNADGGCDLTTTDCGKYACESNACVGTCTTDDDCDQATDYCLSGMCTAKYPNAHDCSDNDQCLSGACTNIDGTMTPTQPKICCSSLCTDVPQGTCYSANNIGKCDCSIDCGDGGTCVPWYLDFDGDGYGDAKGMLSNGTLKAACSTTPVPSGWSLTNNDCDDHNSKVFPGQTEYFTSGDNNNYNMAFDYNCDGALEYQTPTLATTKGVGIFSTSTCEFCNGSGFGLERTCSASTTMCSASGQAAGFGCARVFAPCTGICLLGYECSESPDVAYPLGTTPDCGTAADAVNCGTCAAANGAPSPTTVSTTQACH